MCSSDLQELQLASLKGKPVLINLWATWCGPCVLEMPMLDQLAGADGSKLRVVTISQDLQGAAKVVPFFASHKFAHLEPWLDPDNTLGDHYATGILPTTVLYDAQVIAPPTALTLPSLKKTVPLSNFPPSPSKMVTLRNTVGAPA